MGGDEWVPTVGDIVRDTRRDRLACFMGRIGGRYALRPPTGGLEWDAQPDDVRPARTSDLLGPAVADANRRSQGVL